MPYQYLPDIAIADVAFEAWADTSEGLFIAAADATMNVMVGDLSSIAKCEERALRVEEAELDMLLFQLLQELIFYKDAEQLLLRIKEIRIRQLEDRFVLEANACGEKLDPSRHDLVVDVKAVTLHRFHVEQMAQGWKATVILDI
jgi:SHS2 domain-containing protein